MEARESFWTVGKASEDTIEFALTNPDAKIQFAYAYMPGVFSPIYTKAEPSVFWEELLQELDGRTQHILVLLLQGLTAHEISSEIGCTERAVYRTYERIKEWLHRRADE